MPTGLVRLAFATEQLGDEAFKLGPFEPTKPKMYISIGPLVDNMGTVVAMARVIETRNSAVPTDINFSYEKYLPTVFEDQKQEEEVFVLKEKVKQDCKKLAAFEKAGQKANEFVKLAKNKGWEAAIEKFNSLYPARPADELLGQQKESSAKSDMLSSQEKKSSTKAKKKKAELSSQEKKSSTKAKKKKAESVAGEPKPAKDGNESQKTFETQSWNQKNRIFQTDIETVRLSTSQSPGAEKFINQSLIYAKQMDEFYSLFKSNEIQVENVPAVIQFKPKLACYAIKSLSRNPPTIDDYEQSRQLIAYKEDYILSQSMAFEHFMPDNILKRLNLRLAHEPNRPVNQTGNNENPDEVEL
jgi:hypothetical protein